MPDIRQHIRPRRRHGPPALPAWLEALPAGASSVDIEAFFSSPVVLYPGADSDGHPLIVFGSTHRAHCFLYVDQWYRRPELIDTLDGGRTGYDARVRGYHTHARIDVAPEAIVPATFDTALSDRHSRRRPTDHPEAPIERVPKWALLEILARDDDHDDTHGPSRLAILFVTADAFDVYEAAFVRRQRAPYAIVLQDHGFGGNHDRFGGGGRLEALATEKASPRWLMVATNTLPWSDYRRVRFCGRGGCHMQARELFGRSLRLHPRSASAPPDER